MKQIISLIVCAALMVSGCTRINSSAHADASGATSEYEYRTSSAATDNLVNTTSRLTVYAVVLAAVLALAGGLSDAK
jgi:outer membrane murein-binding lipoprotein Lpp